MESILTNKNYHREFANKHHSYLIRLFAGISYTACSNYYKFNQKLTLILIASLFFAFKTTAQDLHFSQYFNSPLLVNPANTGFAPDVDWRIGANYRNQWASVINNPYKTMSIWGDAQLFNERIENGWAGIGGAILRDVAGTGGLTSTRGFASIAYHQLLGQKSLLSGGFNIGFINKRVDLTKFTFDQQWNGKFFDITALSGEHFAFSSVTYLDLQAGLNYAFFPTNNAYINAGFSASHINRPRESFFSGSVADTRLEVRYTAFLNGSFKLNEQWIVNPNFYISKMGTAWETVGGLNTHYNLSGNGSKELIAGAYLRLKDAIIPMIGFELNDFEITFNYDATSSALNKFNQSRGAYEISIVKKGLYNTSGKAVKCPTVSFLK